MKPKISIVMTYYERLHQLTTTLKTFKMHGYKDIEVIVVDDASPTQPLDEETVKTLPFPIKAVRMPPEKDYYNPCIPFNKGLFMAEGDIVIIQNAECAHVGNIVDYVLKNMKDNDYLAFSCYSMEKDNTFNFFESNEWDLSDLKKMIKADRSATVDGDDAWYNHSVHRPCAYHFCSAITRENLRDLNGFDERYAKGIGYDDDEILNRIRKKGLDIKIIDELSVIHQWHYSMPTIKGFDKLLAINSMLYHFVTKKEKGYRGNQKSGHLTFYKIFKPILVFLYVIRTRMFGRQKG